MTEPPPASPNSTAIAGPGAASSRRRKIIVRRAAILLAALAALGATPAMPDFKPPPAPDPVHEYNTNPLARSDDEKYINDVFRPYGAELADLARKLLLRQPLNEAEQNLLKQHINDKFTDGATFVNFAIWSYNVPMLEYLFAHGADLKNDRILREIMEPDDADFGKACLRLFLEYGGSPDAISSDYSLLEWSASEDDLDTFELLLRSGAKLWLPLKDGNALSYAAADIRYKCIEYALRSGLFRDAKLEDIQPIMASLSNYQQRGDAFSLNIRDIARKIILATDYPEDRYTAEIFGGKIPR